MRPTLKSLVAAPVEPEPREPSEKTEPVRRSYRMARTRTNTRQIGGHFDAAVAQAFNVLAAEQDKDNQQLLAEALTMLFKRYGKPVVVEVPSGRRRAV